MMMGRVWSDVPVGAEPGGPYGQKHLGGSIEVSRRKLCSEVSFID